MLADGRRRAGVSATRKALLADLCRGTTLGAEIAHRALPAPNGEHAH
jgi:hypothetical protein